MRGNRKLQKKFKPNSIYMYHLLIYIVGFILSLYTFIRFINSTEQELVDIFLRQELTGSAKQRGAQAIERIIVYYLGKEGIVAVPFIGVIVLLNKFIKELLEYLRFLKKNKLFRQGLVNNLDNDYIPTPFLKRLKNIFKAKYKVYPSSKEMKEALKKNKYYRK